MSYDTKEQALKWGDNRGPAHVSYEKPAIFSMLPDDLSGKRVLSVGCGFGEECHEIKSRGGHVIGSDYSEEMIKIAKSKFPDIEFVTVPMEHLETRFYGGSFDLVFSSLALHCAADLSVPLKQFKRVLNSAGEVVLSTHHPVYWGAERRITDEEKVGLLGYKRDLSTGFTTYYGDYLTDREILTKFRDTFDVSFYHNSLSTIFRAVREAGFFVDELIEPRPLIECQKEFPDFYELAQRVPLFMLLRLKQA